MCVCRGNGPLWYLIAFNASTPVLALNSVCFRGTVNFSWQVSRKGDTQRFRGLRYFYGSCMLISFSPSTLLLPFFLSLSLSVYLSFRLYFCIFWISDLYFWRSKEKTILSDCTARIHFCCCCTERASTLLYSSLLINRFISKISR